MKPSHGRIPEPTADPAQTAVVGLMATTVRDAAAHLDLVAGPHDADRTSLPAPDVSYLQLIETLDVGGLRVAWSSDLGFAVVDPEVAEVTRRAAEVLAGAVGVDLVDLAVRAHRSRRRVDERR